MNLIYFRAEPDLEFEGLLKRQHTRVKYFQGSLMNAMDLERSKVTGASKLGGRVWFMPICIHSNLALHFLKLKEIASYNIDSWNFCPFSTNTTTRNYQFSNHIQNYFYNNSSLIPNLTPNKELIFHISICIDSLHLFL